MAKTDLPSKVGNVIQFPDRHSERGDDPNAWRGKPRAVWTKQDFLHEARTKLGEARETVKRWTEGGAVTREQYIVASVSIPLWEENLAEAEAGMADTTLTFGGIIYAECAGRA